MAAMLKVGGTTISYKLLAWCTDKDRVKQEGKLQD